MFLTDSEKGLPEYDIAVIGGGPAGATFARLTAPFCRVAVLERQQNYSQADSDTQPAVPTRAKCCGGLLAPDAQRELAVQGLTLPLLVLVDPQIFAVRTMDVRTMDVRTKSGAIPERYYQRSYINIHRALFDDWLRSLIPHGVLQTGALVQSIQRTEQGFLVRYRQQGEMKTLTARAIVGADGGGSLVRRTFFPHRPIRHYAAVQEWYEADRRSPFYGALFDSSLTDCYGWLISKNEYLILGGAFPTDHATNRFAQLKEHLERRGMLFAPRLLREGCVVHRPHHLSELCLGSGNVYLLGEAAGFISPSSLEGISYALESGARLAQSMILGNRISPDAHKRYAAATQSIRRRLAGKFIKNPLLYNPSVRRLLLQTGIGSLPCYPATQIPRAAMETDPSKQQSDV